MERHATSFVETSMNELAGGLIGLYLIAVAIKGNSAQAYALIGEELKGFTPWIAALIVLAILGSIKETKPLTMPIIGLALLAFVLKNQAQLTTNTRQLYAELSGSQKSG
jgi:hypothetical protein